MALAEPFFQILLRWALPLIASFVGASVIGHGLLVGKHLFAKGRDSLISQLPMWVGERQRAPQIFRSASTKEAAVRFDDVVEDDHILYEIPT